MSFFYLLLVYLEHFELGQKLDAKSVISLSNFDVKQWSKKLRVAESQSNVMKQNKKVNTLLCFYDRELFDPILPPIFWGLKYMRDAPYQLDLFLASYIAYFVSLQNLSFTVFLHITLGVKKIQFWNKFKEYIFSWEKLSLSVGYD